MDLSNFKVHDWVLVAAGAVMLIFGLVLDWASASVGSVSASGNGPFDYFFTGGIAWLLVTVTGVVAFLLTAKVIASNAVPWNLAFVAATGLATLLMLVRLLLGGGDVGSGGFSVTLDRGPGMYVAFLAAAVACGGAVWKFVNSGGDLKDLTNPAKLKSSVKRVDG